MPLYCDSETHWNTKEGRAWEHLQRLSGEEQWNSEEEETSEEKFKAKMSEKNTRNPDTKGKIKRTQR